MSFSGFMLSKTLQPKAFSLSVTKLFLNSKSLLSYDTADMKRTLAARAIVRAQRVTRGVSKQFSLGEEMVFPARAAETTPAHFSPTYFQRLQKRASIQPTRLDLGVALRTLSHMKRRRSCPHKGHRAVTLFSGLYLQEKERRLGRTVRRADMKR